MLVYSLLDHSSHHLSLHTPHHRVHHQNQKALMTKFRFIENIECHQGKKCGYI